MPNDFINLFLPAGLRVLTSLNGIEKFTERQLDNMKEKLGHLEIKRIKLFKIYVTTHKSLYDFVGVGLHWNKNVTLSHIAKKQIKSPIPYSIEIWKKTLLKNSTYLYEENTAISINEEP